jgi:hypothetical protein
MKVWEAAFRTVSMKKIAPDWIKINTGCDYQHSLLLVLPLKNWRGYPVYPMAIRPIALPYVKIAASL